MYRKVLLIAVILSVGVIAGTTSLYFGGKSARNKPEQLLEAEPAEVSRAVETTPAEVPSVQVVQQDIARQERAAKAQRAGEKSAKDTGSAERLRAAARRYEQRRNYSKAREYYERMARENPAGNEGRQAALSVARTDVLSYIHNKKDDSALAALEKLISDFADDPALASSVYDVARRFERAKKVAEAKDIYARIIAEYPGTEAAESARLSLAKLDIYSLVKSGDYGAAEAIERLSADFSGCPVLSEALYDIAIRCERAKDYELAGDIYDRILQQFPESVHAAKATLENPKTDIIESIRSGQGESAAAAIEKLKAEFSDSPYLNEALKQIAKQYEWDNDYEQAARLHGELAERCGDSDYGRRAQINTAKCEVLAAFEAGDDTAARRGVAELVNDFGDHTKTSWALCQIAKQYKDEAARLEAEGHAEQAAESMAEAVGAYENIINKLPASNATAEAYYMAAEYYRGQSDHAKSAEYYQQLADDYPGYDMAWNAMFLAGDSYEKLAEAGQISKAVADTRTRQVYERLLAEYPDCRAARAARQWLNNNNISVSQDF